ncbi:fumarate hydratase [Chloroflexi bacterium TSY]|nr:fumarate hydratase [Chloroflexi bacterium TSY]
MREMHVNVVKDAVAQLCQTANFELGDDVVQALHQGKEKEAGNIGERVLDTILLNVNIASTESRPMCQDTGTAVIFVKVGQDVHFVGGPLNDAIHDGVRQGYEEGYLRKSMVGDPLWSRENTGDNTPAMIHVDLIPGNQVHLTVMTKGGGAENMSRMAMLTPAMGVDGVRDFVVETVEIAGPNACPPVIVGVGVGGTFDTSPMLAKKALLRRVGKPNDDSQVAAFEHELLEAINKLGIGPHGFGGFTTALAVHVETMATHIASLPVAVNLQCGPAARHRSLVL